MVPNTPISTFTGANKGEEASLRGGGLVAQDKTSLGTHTHTHTHTHRENEHTHTHTYTLNGTTIYIQGGCYLSGALVFMPPIMPPRCFRCSVNFGSYFRFSLSLSL